MKRIEKTKRNISVSSLDEQERKKLFNEFVEAGGEVINEKEKQGLSDFDRDLQKRYAKQYEELKKGAKLHRKANPTRKKRNKNIPAIAKAKEKASKNDPELRKISSMRLFFQRINIRIHLFLMKVTDFAGYYFTPVFFKHFDEEYKSSLLSAQMFYVNIFKQNLLTGNRIIDQLDKMHPIYFELIELLSNVFDRSVINEILEHYYNFPSVPQLSKELREPLTKIFKKLHPLNPYKEHILTGFEKSLNLYTRFEKNKPSSISISKKKVKDDIYIIFNKLYYRLYWLMCYYEERIFLSYKDIENTIPISIKDIPGKRKINEIKFFELPLIDNLSINNDEQEKDEKNILPDPLRKGLGLMNKINLKEKSELYIKNNIFKYENLSDKVYITCLLFDEFDKEYSIILTTNKIKYNTISKSGEKFDYKNRFINIYNSVCKCNNRLKDYADTLAALEKQKQEKPISNTQFIEYSNRLTALEKERKQRSVDARMYVKAFFENLCKDLKRLTEDMETTQDIVINPQDIIVFDSEIEGEKKLNGKKIYEAISYTYNYAMAFIYRLSHSGDLSGEPEFDEEEKNVFDINIPTENISVKESNDRREADKKESILKELDDLI